MDKFVLIDGNSLLNRAYYALNVFSTRDGFPTNGIFGFVKLVLKIIEEKNPAYFAVAFDVHAPTFRHKMYKEYKGTRKPMPEDLVVQVPVLKELLTAMNIRTVELAGYEADDVIGTLSRKFSDVETLIYTGDRDAYQLVNERVSVCFTKRGVTDIELMTAENFYEKEGITPLQIIEQKSLMGDSSDNIPGVRGVGPKSALELLQKFGDLDGVYRNLDGLSPTLRKKLEEGRENAYLSRTLATIDTAVPIDVTKESCRLTLPFPNAAREYFLKLEFRSLVNGAYFLKEPKKEVQTVLCNDFNAFYEQFAKTDCFGFALERNACHISFSDREYVFRIRENMLEERFYLTDLVPMLQTIFSGKATAIVEDGKALRHRLFELGVTLSCTVEDVSLLRYVYDSNLRPVTAKELAKEQAIDENCSAYALTQIFSSLQEACKGRAETDIYRDIELPLSEVLYQMEETGVRVDVSLFSEFSKKYNKELDKVSQEIFTTANVEPFNLNSPFQLSELLFEKLGYPLHGARKNIRGGYSTGADVLEKLAEKHEIARMILRYRELQKLKSTYIDGILPLAVGEIVHTTYNQSMTTTGRLSSANPNLQNIPVRTAEGKELRKLFIAREGNILIDADYSQIELRLLAHFSGCKPLQEAYREGKDIHALTASQVFGVKLADVTPLLRRRAKAVNFGIIYGISAFGLAKDVGCTTQEAQDYIDRYFRTYTDVKEYIDENVRFARENGFVTTLTGRKRFIPEIKSGNFNLRSFGERAAMNMPLQGSAADIIKIAMLRVCRRLKNEKLRSELVLQVHDELVLDAPKAEAERAATVLREEMEQAVSLSIPLSVDVSSGENWYEAK